MHDKIPLPPVSLLDTRVHVLKSTAVEGMEYNIYMNSLPGNGSATDRYPVLYCLDAWSGFGILTEAYRMLRFFGEVPPLLLVGISWEGNAADFLYNRSRDYLPSHIPPEELAARFGQGKAQVTPASGGAGCFLRFIRDELFPFVELEYPVDPANRGIFGYSYGGTFTGWVLFNAPELFQRYLLGSPSLDWDDYLVLKDEQAYAATHSALSARVFASVGSEENTDSWTRLKDRLESRNYEGLQFTATMFKGETHASCMPAAYSRALRVLYGG